MDETLSLHDKWFILAGYVMLNCPVSSMGSLAISRVANI